MGAPEFGIADLADLEGAHTQFVNLFTILGRYDLQLGDNDRISIRSFYTQNKTDGFTGGRGQNQIQADFGNTENFENSGHNSVLTWNKVLSGGKAFNELKVSYYDSKRPRQPNSTIPEIVDRGHGHHRSALLPAHRRQPGQVHRAGELPVRVRQARREVRRRHQRLLHAQQPVLRLVGGLLPVRHPGGLRGQGSRSRSSRASASTACPTRTPPRARTAPTRRASGSTPRTSGRCRGTSPSPTACATTAPTTRPRSRPIQGQRVYSGVEPDISIGAPPQGPPSDWKQFGPRVGAAYTFDIGNRPAVLRANWGYYYAQTPPIFYTTPGREPHGRQLLLLQPGLLPPRRVPQPQPGLGARAAGQAACSTPTTTIPSCATRGS